MGAPVAGSDVRAYVMTGGGLRLKGLALKWRSRRCQMIFPLRGAERRGLVSLEAKKRKVLTSEPPSLPPSLLLRPLKVPPCGLLLRPLKAPLCGGRRCPAPLQLNLVHVVLTGGANTPCFWAAEPA
jgi:hypothetical protein